MKDSRFRCSESQGPGPGGSLCRNGCTCAKLDVEGGTGIWISLLRKPVQRLQWRNWNRTVTKHETQLLNTMSVGVLNELDRTLIVERNVYQLGISTTPMGINGDLHETPVQCFGDQTFCLSSAVQSRAGIQ